VRPPLARAPSPDAKSGRAGGGESLCEQHSWESDTTASAEGEAAIVVRAGWACEAQAPAQPATQQAQLPSRERDRARDEVVRAMLKEKAFPLQRIWEVLSCGPTWQTSGGGSPALAAAPGRETARLAS